MGRRYIRTMSVITKASQKCLDIIIDHEQLRLVAYDDARGRPLRAGERLLGKLTNGYGHRGKDVFVGQVIDEAKALDWLKADVATAERAVLRNVRVPLTQNQFDALVDFVFNAGSGNFAGSTLLRELNSGHYKNAANELLKWIYATEDGKKVIKADLQKRRARERELFLSA